MFARVFYGPVNDFITGYADVNERECAAFLFFDFCYFVHGLEAEYFFERHYADDCPAGAKFNLKDEFTFDSYTTRLYLMRVYLL